MGGSRAEEPLLSAFPAATLEQWREQVEPLLRGASFEERLTTPTPEGIRLRPLYTRADSEGLAGLDRLPGEAPYTRGGRPAAAVAWQVAQRQTAPDAERLAARLERDLASGADAACIRLDDAGREGLDPGEARPGQVGAGGTSLVNAAALERALRPVDPARMPLHLCAGSSALPAAALVAAWRRGRGAAPAAWRGSVGFDPLAALAVRGRLPLSVERAWDEIAALARWGKERAPALATIAVDAAAYADAGASAIQELAFALASGAASLRALEARGLELEDAAPRMRFCFAVGPRLLVEMAKLRAARLTWSRLVEACGAPPEAGRMLLHARSSRWTATLFDSHANALRASVAAVAAVLGGCDSLELAPWDEARGGGDEQAARLARNTQLLLREEARLHRVADPAGGAWLVERLTRELAEGAWSLMQQIEGEGGMLAALVAGTPQRLVARTAESQERALAVGDAVLIGTTLHVQASEPPPAPPRPRGEPAADADAWRGAGRAPEGEVLAALDRVMAAAPEARFDALEEAAAAGATLGEMAKALRAGDEDPPRIAPLRVRAAAAGFEDLRRDVLAWRAREPSPQVLLIDVGDGSDHGSRLAYAKGVFEVGGFEVASERAVGAAEAARRAAQSAAPAIALVGAEPDAVPELAGALGDARPDAWLGLVHRPSDEAEREAFRAAGIDAFLHRGADVVALLGALARRLGARP